MAMTAKPRNLSRTALLLAAMAFVLPGCGAVDLQDYNPWTVGEWRQIPDRPINHVELVSMEHIVAFRPSAIRLDQGELGRLRYFVETSRAQSSDLIMIHTPRTAAGLDGTRVTGVTRPQVRPEAFLGSAESSASAKVPVSSWRRR